MGFQDTWWNILNVKFGDSSCNGFLRYRAENRQIDWRTDRQTPLKTLSRRLSSAWVTRYLCEYTRWFLASCVLGWPIACPTLLQAAASTKELSIDVYRDVVTTAACQQLTTSTPNAPPICRRSYTVLQVSRLALLVLGDTVTSFKTLLKTFRRNLAPVPNWRLCNYSWPASTLSAKH